MYLPFDSLPDHSRIWIYQSDRSFTDSEKTELESGLRALCDQWSAHGTPLHTSFTIAYDQFIIMAVDEQRHGASGCSIDGSVRFLKEIQSKAGLDFFNRTNIAFLVGNKVETHSLASLKSLFDGKTLTGDSITLNNSIGTKGELKSHWKEAASQGWLSRYLPKTTV